jgi:hypothetical protein
MSVDLVVDLEHLSRPLIRSCLMCLATRSKSGLRRRKITYMGEGAAAQDAGRRNQGALY